MVPRLCKVLSRSGHIFRERDFSIVCRRCQHERNITECVTKSVGETRSYRCATCDELLVLIGCPTDRVITDERRGDNWWSIRPTNDLIVKLKSENIRIPAARGAPVFGAPLI